MWFLKQFNDLRVGVSTMELGSNNFCGISSMVTYFTSLVIYLLCVAQISRLLLTVVISKWYIGLYRHWVPKFKLTQIARKFSCDVPWSNSSQKIFYYESNFKRDFFTQYRNIEKAGFFQAPHTFLAHHLLGDVMQSIWMSVVTQRLVIQFSKSFFVFKGLCLQLPTKTKVAIFFAFF